MHILRPIALTCLLLLQHAPTASLALEGSFFGPPNVNATYDYVVVGGGTSGLTVAKRLAETPATTVAIIEAGGFYEFDNGNYSQIPAYATRGTLGDVDDNLPAIDWGFITTPQAGLDNRRVRYAQGKTLGGDSARNVLAYQRGVAGAFQQWADEVEDQGFTFSNLLPYFKKSPAFTSPNRSYYPVEDNIYDAELFSPCGGPLRVAYPNYLLSFTPYMNTAFQRLGMPQLSSLYGGQMLGYAYNALTLNEDQTRSSSQTSFLQSSIVSNQLIQVYIRTAAKRILFDQNKTATGVLVSSWGKPYQLNARKEVIVAAGVFKTPQLLMVSGIGPKRVLDSLNITALSVLEGLGQNFWDHPYYGIGYRTNLTTAQRLSNPTYLNQANVEFLSKKSGPLTNVGSDLIGFAKVPARYRSNFSESVESKLAAFAADWPELELLPTNVATFPVNDTADYFSVTIANTAGVSRGTVTINSTDTDDQPVINPNWLTAEADQQVAIAAVKLARDLGVASGASVGPEFFPGPAVETDAQILDFVRQTAYTLHHGVGTAKMGQVNDSMAVVSTTGKVFGVNALRVVDASTMRLLPPGHCQGIVYMLAERYADMVKKGC